MSRIHTIALVAIKAAGQHRAASAADPHAGASVDRSDCRIDATGGAKDGVDLSSVGVSCRS